MRWKALGRKINRILRVWKAPGGSKCRILRVWKLKTSINTLHLVDFRPQEADLLLRGRGGMRLERCKLRVDLRALSSQLSYSACFYRCERERWSAEEGAERDAASSSSSCHAKSVPALHARRAAFPSSALSCTTKKASQQVSTSTSVAYHGGTESQL